MTIDLDQIHRPNDSVSKETYRETNIDGDIQLDLAREQHHNTIVENEPPEFFGLPAEVAGHGHVAMEESGYVPCLDQARLIQGTHPEHLSGDEIFDRAWFDHLSNHAETAVRERFETAYHFYVIAFKEESSNGGARDLGYSKEIHDKALQHMRGINFNRDVSVVTIQPGILVQYQYPERLNETGSYFTKESPKEELGIQGDSKANQTRLEVRYTVNQDVIALRSTSLDIENWSTYNDPGRPERNGKAIAELNYGGGIQFFIPRSVIDASISRIEPSDLSEAAVVSGKPSESRDQRQSESISLDTLAESEQAIHLAKIIEEQENANARAERLLSEYSEVL